MNRDEKNTMIAFFGAIILIAIMLMSTVINIFKISKNLNEDNKNINAIDKNGNNAVNTVIGDE